MVDSDCINIFKKRQIESFHLQCVGNIFIDSFVGCYRVYIVMDDDDELMSIIWASKTEICKDRKRLGMKGFEHVGYVWFLSQYF